MSDPMAEIKTSFFLECEELLEQLQDGLKLFEEGDEDSETINEIFRAVHSIKGGAGAFGLTALVEFAHVFETSLDVVRTGVITPGPEDYKTFLRASDVLSDLVAASRDETDVREEQVSRCVAELRGFLGVSAGDDTDNDEVDPSEFQPTGVSMNLPEIGGNTGGLPQTGPLLPDLNALPGTSGENPDAPADLRSENQPGQEPASEPLIATGQDSAAPKLPEDISMPESHNFLIRFRPEPALFSSGNEPLHLLRTLAEFGKIQVICNCDELPGLEKLDAEESYISWEIRLATRHSEKEVREVFDFVEDLCELQIEMLPEGAELALPRTDARIAAPDETSPENTGPPQIPPQVSDMPSTPLPPQTAAPATAQNPVSDNPETAAEPPSPKPDPMPAAATATPRPAPARPAAARPAAAGADKNGAGKAGPAAPKNTAKPVQAGGTVRVELERVDRLVNLVGELVINQAMLSQSVSEAGVSNDQNVTTGLDEFMQLTRDIQDSVMAIRAQPVKSLFQRMARIVREASSEVGKDVRMVTIGENTEVDKTVIERLADPLTHMIRNAVDHGLEDGGTRAAAGKSEQGIVTLSATHKSGRFLIEVSDDGAGINRPVVLQKAREKGLVTDEAQLSDAEIDNLLFLPGFSTATEISNLSGRGVGMDVVRNSIAALGGRISISSEKGVGTKFSISLPLTLAVQDGMVIEVAGQTLVVPLNNIIETVILTADNLREMGPSTTVVQLRDKFVPLLDLAVELGFSAPKDNYNDCSALLISPEEDQTAAFVIDRIVEQRQVMIKGLQDSYGAIPGVAAATILGDGQIALILDAGDVIAHASGRTRATNTQLQLTGVCA